MVRYSAILLGSFGLSTAVAQSYKIAKSYVGQGFADDFNFYTKDDPTGGYVNYLSREDATNKGLLTYDSSTFTMAVDAKNVASGRGRDSVRISSKDRFNDGIYILDLAHMPVGCGTWPAYWTTTEHHWPNGGEIDILEGANGLPAENSTAWSATANLKSPSSGFPPNADTSSLHTRPGCSLVSSAQTGIIKTTACDSKINNNAGCGIQYSNATTSSIGLQLNQQNGGWYAMKRDVQGSGGIYMWFWARNDATVPQEVKDGSFGGDISAANWGVPAANFTIPDCKKDFNDHVIVFNIALCGDYTAATYSASGCPGSCASFVLGNPLAFADAYFKLNSLRVFTANGQIASKAGPEGLSTGALAGIVVAAVVVALGLIGAFLWRLRRKRREAATARALAPRALNDLSTSSVISTTDSDKEEAGYPVGVLLPGETATRSKAHGSRDPRRGSASANTKKASKGSSSKKGYAATATTESGRASGANRPKQDVPVPPANPAFAFSNNQTKDKFRPGWAV